VEAIAFAAAGFLFGKEVHRERAEKAEERADDAEMRARKSGEGGSTMSANGNALATLIRTKANGIDEKLVELDPQNLIRLIKAEFNELAALANGLFPEIEDNAEEQISLINENKTLKDRIAALEELLGMKDDDDIERELAKAKAKSSVDEELQRLRDTVKL
jgi:uncharacterized protein YicC (UPF0701 family)